MGLSHHPAASQDSATAQDPKRMASMAEVGHPYELRYRFADAITDQFKRFGVLHRLLKRLLDGRTWNRYLHRLWKLSYPRPTLEPVVITTCSTSALILQVA